MYRQERGMKAGIYARVSTKAQKEEGTSLDSQIKAMKEWASQNGYEAPKEYVIKEDWPGDELDAPGLSFIRGLIRECKIDTLLVYAYDRLARNRRKQAIILYECEKAKVELVSITEPSQGGLVGEFLRDALAFAAELEREKIRERVIRGKRSRAVDKRLCSGPLYGYTYKDGVREADPHQASVVQAMFTWLIEEQVTIYEITKRLKGMGILAVRGGKTWSHSTIYGILTNPAYCGRAYALRWKHVEPKSRRKSPPKTRNTRKIMRPREEWILLPDTTPPIISEEMFEATQRQLKRNKANARRNKKHDYLLGGRLYCECGQRMYGDATKGYRYYRCHGRDKQKAKFPCHHATRAQELENLVWNEISATLQNPDLICAELDRMHAGEPSLADRDLEAVVQVLAHLDLEERRYLRLYGNEKFDERKLQDEVDRVRTEREGWLNEKAVIEERIKAKEGITEQKRTVREYCRLVSENLERLDLPHKRLALEALEVTIMLGFDGGVTIRGAIPKVRHVTTPLWSGEYTSETGVPFALQVSLT